MISILRGMFVMCNGRVEIVAAYDSTHTTFYDTYGVYNREELSLPSNLDIFLHIHKGLTRVKKGGGPLCLP